jgi:hypothetical protein
MGRRRQRQSYAGEMILDCICGMVQSAMVYFTPVTTINVE